MTSYIQHLYVFQLEEFDEGFSKFGEALYESRKKQHNIGEMIKKFDERNIVYRKVVKGEKPVGLQIDLFNRVVDLYLVDDWFVDDLMHNVPKIMENNELMSGLKDSIPSGEINYWLVLDRNNTWDDRSLRMISVTIGRMFGGFIQQEHRLNIDVSYHENVELDNAGSEINEFDNLLIRLLQ